MSEIELQEEEREVLISIYEGDLNFKQLNGTTFQYKYGEDNAIKSFLLELQWSKNYPSEKPTVNMDAFYNKHLTNPVKEKVLQLVSDFAEQNLGTCMTFSLFEYVKERFDELIVEQPDTANEASLELEKLGISDLNSLGESNKKLPKKEQLTKAQKRRQWNKVDASGEKPRGWNWVDIVKHLSQTGGAKQETSTSS